MPTVIVCFRPIIPIPTLAKSQTQPRPRLIPATETIASYRPRVADKRVKQIVNS